MFVGSSSRNAKLHEVSLGLLLLTLYGVGITVGTGIYVLIGAVASHAGMMALWRPCLLLS